MVTLTVVVVATAALPSAYELDFGVLPPANAARYYEYTVVLSFPDEPDVKIPIGHGKGTGPAEAADWFRDALNDARWKVKQDGERIIIYGYDDVRVTRVTVEGKKMGPQPLVRRVLVPPPEKK
jgi:hypothetical protein